MAARLKLPYPIQSTLAMPGRISLPRKVFMRLDPSKLESVQQLGIEKRFCADIIRNVRSHFHSVLADLARYHLLEIPPLPSLQRLILYQIVDEIEPLGGKLPKMILPELLPDPIIPTLLISHIIIDQLPAAPNLFLIDLQSENNLTRGKPSSLMTSKILIRSFDPPLGGPTFYPLRELTIPSNPNSIATLYRQSGWNRAELRQPLNCVERSTRVI